MADISMCENKDCPSKDDCYRFTAPPNPFRQSYSVFDFGYEVSCEEYIPNGKMRRNDEHK